MAGAMMAGSAIQSGFDAAQSGLSYLLTSKLMAKSQKWQERMSNTQYQRTMADLQEAGLNPMLAIKGTGAGTPTGGAGTIAPHGANTVQAGINTAIAKKQLEKMEAELRVLEFQADRESSTAGLNDARAKREEVLTQHDEYTLPKAATMSAFDRSRTGQFINMYNRGAQGILSPLGHLPFSANYHRGRSTNETTFVNKYYKAKRK